MRMTQAEFDALCARSDLKVTVQAGASRQPEVPEKPKVSKYRNRKVYVYASGLVLNEKKKKFGPIDETYDSEKEYQRHLELKMLERAGAVTDLRRQVPFLIQAECVRGDETIRAINYVADFCYTDPLGREIVEDVKGQDKTTGKYITTKDFLLKWKLLKYRYPDKIFRIF